MLKKLQNMKGNTYLEMSLQEGHFTRTPFYSYLIKFKSQKNCSIISGATFSFTWVFFKKTYSTRIRYPEVFAVVFPWILRHFIDQLFYGTLHCMKSVQIWSYFWSAFPLFGLNTEMYGVKLRIQSEYKKIRTRNNSVFGHFVQC